MSTNNKVIKASIGYTIGNYLIKGLSFITVPIFARIMETSDYGIYNSFVAYESIISILIGLAIHSSYKKAKYVYMNRSDGLDLDGFESASIVLVLMSTLGWIIITSIFHRYITDFTSFSYPILVMLILHSMATSIIWCYNANASLNFEYQKFIKIALINAVTNVLLSVLLITSLFSDERYVGRIIGATIPCVVISLVIIFWFLKRKKPKNVKTYLSWGLKYSLPIVPHGISQIILSQFDRIMIIRMVSDSAAGLYSFAYTMYSLVYVAGHSIDGVWTQWSFDKLANKQYEDIKKVSSYYILFLSVLVVGVMLISPELIIILGSVKYSESISCVVPIVCGGYFSLLYGIPCVVEYYHEKTKFIAIATSAAALINIVLNYFFIKAYGYVAAAYTTLFTYILYFAFHYFVAVKIQRRSLFSWKLILLCSALVLVFGMASLYLTNMILVRWILAFTIAVASIFYEEKKLGYISSYIRKRLN